jgi:hypothetical protein
LSPESSRREQTAGSGKSELTAIEGHCVVLLQNNVCVDQTYTLRAPKPVRAKVLTFF